MQYMAQNTSHAPSRYFCPRPSPSNRNRNFFAIDASNRFSPPFVGHQTSSPLSTQSWATTRKTARRAKGMRACDQKPCHAVQATLPCWMATRTSSPLPPWASWRPPRCTAAVTLFRSSPTLVSSFAISCCISTRVCKSLQNSGKHLQPTSTSNS